MNSENESLSLLTAELHNAMAMSRQGSYERRMPAAEALPKLRHVLKGLRVLVRVDPGVKAWRALALAEEALLHYPAAVIALESAMALSAPVDRKDLKRLAQLREYAAKWHSLGLSAPVLQDLGRFLESTLAMHPCDHSHRHTTTWLSENGITAPRKAIEGMKKAGGYCDCEVLLNVV
jgi:hypothetical protein